MIEKIVARLKLLRVFLEENKTDFFIIPTSDYHNSEYVSDFFKVREFFSGFDGSNGTLVISKEKAGLWTDGRYFLQAEQQLEGTGIDLFKMGEEGVLSIFEYITSEMKEGQTIGFNGMTISAFFGKKLEKIIRNKKGHIVYNLEPAKELWKERPELPVTNGWVLEEQYAGKSFQEKLKEIRIILKDEQAEYLVLSKLDDIMWLFNLRGSDIECNPVLVSYAFITKKHSYIFLQNNSVTTNVKKYLQMNNIILNNYNEIFDFLEEFSYRGKVWMDTSNVNYSLYKKISDNSKYIEKENPTELLKAIKNEIEQECIREIYLKDSVAVTKFIYQLSKQIGNKKITEVSAAKIVDDYRREIDGFLDLSFPTISAYDQHAAIIHYEPGEIEVELKQKGLLMVDSGGQYLKGTTDVTRTISLGEISETIKKHYAYVCTGMLALQDAKFMYGATGRNLDILARQPLWEEGLDYRHGTGHGIGFVLNVHEGPQNIRWKYLPNQSETVFEDGMIVSDEPGIYIQNSHGIRIENILLCKTFKETEYGKFMKFIPLTYVPLDSNILDPLYLTKDTILKINHYQRAVFEKISPFLNNEECSWLKKFTKEI